LKTLDALHSAVNGMVADVERLDFSNQATYALWLSQAYHFVRHSTPLLALSCGRSVSNRSYHLRCIGHLAEEKGHDRLLLNDLKQLGYSIHDCPEFASTSAFYQSQYFWIEHVNPVSFLGYIYVLEALAVLQGKVKISQVQAFGADSFLKIHADEDSAHLEQAAKLISTLAESDQLQIIKNAQQASALYQLIVRDIAASAANWIKDRDALVA
jgi:hypothetical protein